MRLLRVIWSRFGECIYIVDMSHEYIQFSEFYHLVVKFIDYFIFRVNGRKRVMKICYIFFPHYTIAKEQGMTLENNLIDAADVPAFEFSVLSC